MLLELYIIQFFVENPDLKFFARNLNMDYSSNTANVLLENFNSELPFTRKLHALYQSHRFIHIQMLAIGDKQVQNL